MVTLPTSVPASIRQGSTAQWHLLLPEYLASDGWSVSIRLANAAGKYDIGGTDNWTDDDGHDQGEGDWRFDLNSTDSAGFSTGRYQWFLIGVNGQDKKIISQGFTNVEPSVFGSDQALFDVRTHARRMLEAIEAVLEKRATSDQQAYSIGGRSLTRTPIPELIKLRGLYRREVAAEDRAARFGSVGPGKVRVRL